MFILAALTVFGKMIIFIVCGIFVSIVVPMIVKWVMKEKEPCYIGPFPRTVKARRAYGWQLVDAKILGTRKRFFLTRYIARYTFRNDFLGRCEVTRYIRESQIMKV